MRTVAEVIGRLNAVQAKVLPALPHTPRDGLRVGLAVESMRRHTTDEGWQLFAGLQHAGYLLRGWRLTNNETNVAQMLDVDRPSVVLLQDKREWDGLTAGGARTFDDRERYTNVEALNSCGAFVGTVLKDSQHSPEYHRKSASEIGAHFWVTYYHPSIVSHLAKYVRPQHLVRTYHSVDADIVPTYTAEGRSDYALLSGAVSNVYPLRQRLFKSQGPWTAVTHPGYRRDGCFTPTYIGLLTRYKVAICTTSVYGYTVRKLIEATAAGCRVVTDLPVDDPLPFIDGNMVRVSNDASPAEIADVVRWEASAYDPETQRRFATRACTYYDYRAVGRVLAADIEKLRLSYETV